MSDKQKMLLDTGKKQKIAAENRIHEDSKDRLKGVSSKKFRTCFVSAISEFEMVFGLELWGHGLPEDELSSTQKANRERWNQVRTSVLNKGNTQLRAMEAEIDLHEVKFKGYKMEIGGNVDGC